jgi:GH15 family glucan-1,4-alpha-glucosidase
VLEWLPGYERSRPVRIGNAASTQLQLDVYGEVLDAAYQTLAHGVERDDNAWSLIRMLLSWLEDGWREKDAGIWEVRGPARHFTHSKVMAWVAFDRAVRFHEQLGRAGPVDRWRSLRDEIHRDVTAHAWNAEKQAFTQSFGSDQLDASALLMPAVGFLPATDPRFESTVEAIRRDLTDDGLVRRYQPRTDGLVDGIESGEGVFLACSFWLADALALQGKLNEARELFERLLDLRNDLGLLAEQYDPASNRQLGNFPQAFTHLALVNTALVLGRGRGMRHAPTGSRPQSGQGDGGSMARR